MPYQVYYPVCTTTLPDHISNSCADSMEHGRVRSVAFVHVSYLAALQVDPTDYAIWQTGILDKLIIIIPETTGTYDGGTPVEGPGYGDLAVSLAGYDHVIAYSDPNFKQNAEFYNAIKYSREWVPVIRLETTALLFDVAGQILPKAPVTEALTDDVVWAVEVKVSQPNIPVPFIYPPDIFIPFALF